MISAKVDDSQVIAKFSRFPQDVYRTLIPAMDKIGVDLVTHVVRDKLSGQVLNRRSGKLSNAVTHTPPAVSADSVTTSVGVFSGVPYARPLEYGATIPAVSGKLMVFEKDGQLVFTRKRRSFQLKEYRYLRSSLEDMKDSILTQITKAVQEAS